MVVRRRACFAEKPLIIRQRSLLGEVASQILPTPRLGPDNRYALPIKSLALWFTVGFDFSGYKSQLVFHNFSSQGCLSDEFFQLLHVSVGSELSTYIFRWQLGSK